MNTKISRRGKGDRLNRGGSPQHFVRPRPDSTGKGETYGILKTEKHVDVPRKELGHDTRKLAWENEQSEGHMSQEEEKLKDKETDTSWETEIEEIKQENETEVLECNVNKRDWEKEMAELKRRLEEEKQKVKETEKCWEREVKEIKLKTEKEVQEYNANKRAWENEKAELKRSLEEENQKFKEAEKNWENEMKEIKMKNKTEVQEYNANKRAWENEKAELKRSLEEEKHKVKKTDKHREKEINEIKLESEKEVAEYKAKKRDWGNEKAELKRSLEEEKQKVKESKRIWENEIKEIKLKTEKEVEEYNAKKRAWENEKVELKRSLEEEKQKVKEIERCRDKDINEIKRKSEKECEKLRKRLEKHEESLSKAEEDNKTWQKSYKELQQDKERELKKSTKEMNDLLNRVASLKAEKDILLTRLSRIASDRMTHGNVNIADLSDADRPTKLQEVYSELYDNEWTDAYDELTNHQNIPEQDAIKTLLDILMNSFQKCREITWGRYERLICAVSSVDIVQGTSLSSTEKDDAKEKVDSCHSKVRDASKDTLEQDEEKNAVNENTESGKQNADAASKDNNEDEKDKTEIKGNVEIFPLSNISASEVQNAGQITVTTEHMMSVSNPETSNNASQELKIAYTLGKEVERPSQYEEHFTSTITLHIDQEKQIKDIWRTTTAALKNEAVKHLYLVLLTSFDIPIKDLENTSKYLTSCIDLCWKMGFQENPMYLDAVAEKDINSEKMFDEDKFKAYTKSGERVDFVVWPALFLNEGGPMLFKGIAQGCKKSD